MVHKAFLKEIEKILDKISLSEFNSFIDTIKKAPRIYVIGAGRSGLMAKAFAMRLVHLKKKVFVVGETVTPAMRKGDVLLAVSGSGKTTMVTDVAETSRKIGGKIIAITATKDSPLSRLAHLIVFIPTKTRESVIRDYPLRELMGMHTPLGSLFEISTLLFFEICVSELMRELGIKEDEMKKIHANL